MDTQQAIEELLMPAAEHAREAEALILKYIGRAVGLPAAEEIRLLKETSLLLDGSASGVNWAAEAYEKRMQLYAQIAQEVNALHQLIQNKKR